MDTQIDVLAIRLAIVYSEESDVPAKYKSNKKKMVEKETNIQQKFDEKINDWKLTLNEMFNCLGKNIAAQYIFFTPVVSKGVKSVTESAQFLQFNEYLIKRRDIENCGDGELGCLVELFGTIQKAIEKEMGLIKPKEVLLKNERAQQLMDQRKVKIDGVELNLWHGHSFDSIRAQQGWNKVQSFTELNQKTEGENGDITFTGTMQIPRQEAQNYAIKLGFRVHSNISKNIEFVVVGTENVSPTKIAEVQKLKEKGIPIRIMSEIEFLEMVIDFLEN
jgi:NAD-dependent DNA ligase